MTYGIIDAISLWLAGFPAMSFSLGHKSPPELLASFRKKIYLLPDGDNKDDQTVVALAVNLGWRGKIIEMPYPEGTKDCNGILMKLGLDGLKGMMNEMIQMDTIYKMKIRKVTNERTLSL